MLDSTNLDLYVHKRGQFYPRELRSSRVSNTADYYVVSYTEYSKISTVKEPCSGADNYDEFYMKVRPETIDMLRQDMLDFHSEKLALYISCRLIRLVNLIKSMLNYFLTAFCVAHFRKF